MIRGWYTHTDQLRREEMEHRWMVMGWDKASAAQWIANDKRVNDVLANAAVTIYRIVRAYSFVLFGGCPVVWRSCGSPLGFWPFQAASKWPMNGMRSNFAYTRLIVYVFLLCHWISLDPCYIRDSGFKPLKSCLLPLQIRHSFALIYMPGVVEILSIKLARRKPHSR